MIYTRMIYTCVCAYVFMNVYVCVYSLIKLLSISLHPLAPLQLHPSPSAKELVIMFLIILFPL